jgi:hypothetical protein
MMIICRAITHESNHRSIERYSAKQHRMQGGLMEMGEWGTCISVRDHSQ